MLILGNKDFPIVYTLYFHKKFDASFYFNYFDIFRSISLVVKKNNDPALGLFFILCKQRLECLKMTSGLL